MSSSSKILLIDSRRPVDAVTSEILCAINQALGSAEIPYMLVGAAARDLLLHHVHGLPVTRATNDFDFAISVGSWDHFRLTRGLLLNIQGFLDKQRTPHRMHYKPSGMAWHGL